MPHSQPSLLEYARCHGLATDHRLQEVNLSTALQATTNDITGPFSIIAPPIPLPEEPKLQLNKTEINLLTTSLQTPSPPSWDQVLPDHHRIRNLKLEIPLLLTDHAVDLKRFTERPSLDLDDLGIFAEQHGHCHFDLAEEWDAKVSGEKLQATKQDIMYLQHIVQDQRTPEAYQQLLRDALPTYTHKPLVDENEIELQERPHLQDLQVQSPLVSQKRPISPPAMDLLHSSGRQFSATRSLLGFMSTRGDISKRLKSTSHHFSKVQSGDETTL